MRNKMQLQFVITVLLAFLLVGCKPGDSSDLTAVISQDQSFALQLLPLADYSSGSASKDLELYAIHCRSKDAVKLIRYIEQANIVEPTTFAMYKTGLVEVVNGKPMPIIRDNINISAYCRPAMSAKSLSAGQFLNTFRSRQDYEKQQLLYLALRGPTRSGNQPALPLKIWDFFIQGANLTRDPSIEAAKIVHRLDRYYNPCVNQNLPAKSGFTCRNSRYIIKNMDQFKARLVEVFNAAQPVWTEDDLVEIASLFGLATDANGNGFGLTDFATAAQLSQKCAAVGGIPSDGVIPNVCKCPNSSDGVSVLVHPDSGSRCKTVEPPPSIKPEDRITSAPGLQGWGQDDEENNKPSPETPTPSTGWDKAKLQNPWGNYLPPVPEIQVPDTDPEGLYDRASQFEAQCKSAGGYAHHQTTTSSVCYCEAMGGNRRIIYPYSGETCPPPPKWEIGVVTPTFPEPGANQAAPDQEEATPDEVSDTVPPPANESAPSNPAPSSMDGSLDTPVQDAARCENKLGGKWLGSGCYCVFIDPGRRFSKKVDVNSAATCAELDALRSAGKKIGQGIQNGKDWVEDMMTTSQEEAQAKCQALAGQLLTDGQGRYKCQCGTTGIVVDIHSKVNCTDLAHNKIQEIEAAERSKCESSGGTLRAKVSDGPVKGDFAARQKSRWECVCSAPRKWNGRGQCTILGLNSGREDTPDSDSSEGGFLGGLFDRIIKLPGPIDDVTQGWD